MVVCGTFRRNLPYNKSAKGGQCLNEIKNQKGGGSPNEIKIEKDQRELY